LVGYRKPAAGQLQNITDAESPPIHPNSEYSWLTASGLAALRREPEDSSGDDRRADHEQAKSN
jgi:hypothetical protein